jgi:hypothetical protein
MPDHPDWIESTDYDAPWVRIRGRVDRAGQVTWSPCLRTYKDSDGNQHAPVDQEDDSSSREPAGDRSDANSPSGESVAQPGEYDYWIACQTEQRHTLARTEVQPRWFAEDQQTATFTVRLPYHRTTRRVILGRGAKPLGELDVPASTPNFDLTHPVRVDDIDTHGILHLRWQPGQGAKRHPHTYFVRFTSDGRRFCRVGFSITGTNFDLDLRVMPGGDHCYAQVLATNGYQTAAAATPLFTLPAKATQLMLGPLDGPALFAQGFSSDNIPITGEQIEWSVDGKPVSRGGSFNASTLTEGQHVVTVSATGPDGNRISQDLGLYDGRNGKLVEGTRRL